jgi:hypothetical protein
MLFIDAKKMSPLTKHARGCFSGMIHRRNFLSIAAVLSAASLVMFAPTNVTLAQQLSSKATVKISELRGVVKQYVDHLSQLSKEYTGVEFSQEEKNQMIADTIFAMQAERFYTYIDP